jgi:hypothetical protein
MFEDFAYDQSFSVCNFFVIFAGVSHEKEPPALLLASISERYEASL